MQQLAVAKYETPNIDMSQLFEKAHLIVSAQVREQVHDLFRGTNTN